MKSAFDKHGVDNFEFSVLCELPNEELNDREILEIRERNTLAPTGYNLETGGNNSKFIHTESRLKMSESAKGKVISNETRRKLSDALKGIKRSEETTAKRSKKVEQWSIDHKTLIEVHCSISSAKRKLGISNISKCCLGKSKSAGGFFWKFNSK
jgi:hypothetical protein